MKIERKRDGRIAILELRGECGYSNLDEFQSNLDGLIETGSRRIVLNLHSLHYFNAITLSYLIRAAERLRRSDGQLVLADPSQYVTATARAWRLDRVFTILGTERDAIEHLRGGDGSAAAPARLQPKPPFDSSCALPDDQLPNLG